MFSILNKLNLYHSWLFLRNLVAIDPVIVENKLIPFEGDDYMSKQFSYKMRCVYVKKRLGLRLDTAGGMQ